MILHNREILEISENGGWMYTGLFDSLDAEARKYREI